jgi:hypothetical protein
VTNRKIISGTVWSKPAISNMEESSVPAKHTWLDVRPITTSLQTHKNKNEMTPQRQTDRPKSIHPPWGGGVMK